MNIPQVEIFQSIYSGSEVEDFLEENNLKLKDVTFEKRYMNKWDNYESIVVSTYRDATPEEAIEIKKREEEERLKSIEFRKEQFERLKREFGE